MFQIRMLVQELKDVFECGQVRLDPRRSCPRQAEVVHRLVPFFFPYASFVLTLGQLRVSLREPLLTEFQLALQPLLRLTLCAHVASHLGCTCQQRAQALSGSSRWGAYLP